MRHHSDQSPSDRPRLAAGLRLERMSSSEIVALDATSGRVHRLTGDAAQAIAALTDEARPALPPTFEPALDALRSAGIVTGGPDRRAALTAAAAATLGVLTLALPRAAAAASPDGGGGGSGGSAYIDPTSGGTTGLPLDFPATAGFDYRTFTTSGDLIISGSGTLTADLLVVGGGGGGAFGGIAPDGGGGAGAAIARLDGVALTGGSTYTVNVGIGGPGGQTLDGGFGTASLIFGPGFFGLNAPSGGVGRADGEGGGSSGTAEGGDLALSSPGGSGSLSGGGAGSGGSATTADGGPGFAITGFFGTTITLGGGGGGYGGSGGSGGGGNTGAQNVPGADATGFGAGGGGGGYQAGGGAGSPGLVVVRYAAP
jgi:hypothetical protein